MEKNSPPRNQGLIPVIYGDVIWDKKWKSTIYSGETTLNKIGIYLTRNLTPVKSQDGHVETYILERSNYVLSLSVRDGNRFENIRYEGVFPGRENMLISFSDKGKVGLEGGDGYRSYIEGMTFNVFNTINTNYARIVNVEYAGVIRGIAEGITQKPPIKVEK